MYIMLNYAYACAWFRMPFGLHRLPPLRWHRPASASTLHAPKTGLPLLYQASQPGADLPRRGSVETAAFDPAAGSWRRFQSGSCSPFAELVSRSHCPSFRIGNGNFPFPEIIARTVPLVLLAKFQWATALSHDIHF